MLVDILSLGSEWDGCAFRQFAGRSATGGLGSVAVAVCLIIACGTAWGWCAWYMRSLDGCGCSEY